MRAAVLLLLSAGLCAALGPGSPGARAAPDGPGAAPGGGPGPLRYLTSAEVGARLESLAARSGPGLPPSSLSEYGRSAGGRPLRALWVGAPERPTVLVHGGLAENDAAGVVAVLALAERLFAPEGLEALRRVSFLLLPAPNPDALDAFLAGAARAGGGALDRDRDGRRGEDGPDDLDGDGEVLTMRRASPRGTYVAGDALGAPGTPAGDPRRLVERGPDARRPASYEVRAEGRDDDGDGEVGEDPPGLDLTRQLAGWWDAQGPWGGEGGFAGAAPEARALMDLSYGASTLVAWYGFRSEGPFLLRASENGTSADADAALYDALSAALAERVKVATRKASEQGRAPNPGSDLDWASAHLGLPAFALPVWRIPKQEGYAAERAAPDDVDWLLWNDRVLGGQGFKPFQPFQHPTLGPVEIGGWRRFTRFEPPPAELSAAVLSVCDAPLVHAGFAPALALTLKVEDLGGGLVEVRGAVLNVGGGPTDLVLAQQRRRDMPVRLRLATEPGVERLAGPASADLGSLVAGAASTEVRWLLRAVPARPGRAPRPVLGTATAEHRVAGRVSETVELR